jgi:hypothetical protein
VRYIAKQLSRGARRTSSNFAPDRAQVKIIEGHLLDNVNVAAAAGEAAIVRADRARIGSRCAPEYVGAHGRRGRKERAREVLGLAIGHHSRQARQNPLEQCGARAGQSQNEDIACGSLVVDAFRHRLRGKCGGNSLKLALVHGNVVREVPAAGCGGPGEPAEGLVVAFNVVELLRERVTQEHLRAIVRRTQRQLPLQLVDVVGGCALHAQLRAQKITRVLSGIESDRAVAGGRRLF